MRAKCLIPAIAAGLIGLGGCTVDFDGVTERYRENFHFSYPMKTGARLVVESFNGSIDLSTWDQDTIDISGTKYARTRDAASELKIDISHATDSVSIRAVRPSMLRGNYGAEFTIKVPKGIVIDNLSTSNASIRTSDGVGPARIKTSNGHVEIHHLNGALRAETSNSSIELEDVTGAVDAHTSNGHIRAEGIRGELSATTSNSSIHANVERAEGRIRLQSSNGSIELTLPAGHQNPVRAHTSNSSITLHLPGEVNARLLASTNNGNIDTEFELREHGEISKHHVDAIIGRGGPLLEVDTSNGAIHIVQ